MYNTKRTMITKGSLRSVYNLSPKLIALLGEPDKYKDNPHYKCAAPMQLFYVDRVESFILAHQEEYEKHLLRLPKYQESGERLAENNCLVKQEERQEQKRRDIETMREYAPLFEDDARNLANRLTFKELPDSVRGELYAKSSCWHEVINHLRHCMTNYDALCRSPEHDDPEPQYYFHMLFRGMVNDAVILRYGLPSELLHGETDFHLRRDQRPVLVEQLKAEELTPAA